MYVERNISLIFSQPVVMCLKAVCMWLYLAPVKSDCDQIYKFLHNTVTDLWARGGCFYHLHGCNAVCMRALLCVFNIHEA